MVGYGPPVSPRGRHHVCGLDDGEVPSQAPGAQAPAPPPLTITDRAVGRLLRWGPAPCALAVVALSLAKYGAGVYPAWRYMQALALHWRNPTVSHLLAPPGAYLLDSPVSAVIAGMLRFTSGRAYLGFHLLLAFFALAVPFALRPVRRSPELRLMVCFLIVGGTVPAVLLSWVGSYDPVSIGAAAVAALAENPAARALAWGLFAFNNAPQAVLALGIYAIVLLVDRGRAGIPRVVVSGLSALAGYIGIRVLTAIWGGGESQLSMMRHYGLAAYLRGYAFWPLLLFSALGVGWLHLVDHEVRRFTAARAFFCLSLLASMGIPLLALDTSRILVGILWPGMLATTDITFKKLTVAHARRVLARLAPVALLLVIVVAWNNTLVYAGWRSLLEFARYLLGASPAPPPP
jgi:hypothetical protein